MRLPGHLRTKKEKLEAEAGELGAGFGEYQLGVTNGFSKLNDRRGQPQVLAHVSTYQGSILEFRFFEPQPNVFQTLYDFLDGWLFPECRVGLVTGDIFQ